ncbi:MAG: hypothetical protein JRG97_15315 [Deltaproteobacteria bacterium]|nr:hypothetical protein [Deltaproteobacteria bacterium]MBW2052933.1 hypothetical protein [Deltaproteobacteria bacterium]MBW2142402.1 hypothetical protein [Deltaproteobacteria bacterium]
MPFILITTNMGTYAYGGKELSKLLLNQADNLLDHSARVISFGAPLRTISPLYSNLLTSFTSKQLSCLTVTLDNNDNEITRAMADVPFIGGILALSLGFEGDDKKDHLNLFSGLIKRIKVNQSEVIIEADEG